MHANTKTEIKSVVHRRMSEFKNLSQEQGSIFELETRLLRQHDVLKSTLPMGILNLDGTLLEVNQALCDLSGYQSRDIVGNF